MRPGEGGKIGEQRPARVLVVDDHDLVRAGVVALLEDEPGVTPCAVAANVERALALARRESPDLALLDVSLSDGDGLRLSLAMKRLSSPPAVVLYTASADPLLGLKARLVGADAVISKAAEVAELVAAIAAALRRDASAPAFDRALARERTAALPPADVAIIGLTLEGTAPDGIAAVLGLEEDEVIRRIDRLLDVLDGVAAADRDRGSPLASLGSRL